MDLPSSEESEEEVENKHRGAEGDDEVPLEQRIRVRYTKLPKTGVFSPQCCSIEVICHTSWGTRRAPVAQIDYDSSWWLYMKAPI